MSAEIMLRKLQEAPERFDLYQALRVIEAAHPRAPRLGEGRRAADEPVRLGQRPFLSFPPTAIAAFERSGGRPPRLSSYVLGLFGPQGPLPLHVTVRARERTAGGPSPLAAFADIFHHRILSLFYRAWAAAQPTVEHDRPDDDRFARRVGAIAGLTTPAFSNRHALPDRLMLAGCGLLAHGSRPPEALERLTRAHFGVAAGVRELVGAWLEVPDTERARLGHSRLGETGIVGIDRFERAQRFRLRLGPLRLAQFRRFLPDGDAIRPLMALVRLVVGPELDAEIQPVLARDEVPPARLDGSVRLGWTSWLHRAARHEDVGDLVLDGHRF